MEVKELVGKTLAEVKHSNSQGYGDEIRFTTHTGEEYVLYHSQDCCESVSVEDISGDLKDLVGQPILMAEESFSREDPEDFKGDTKWRESYTWTFYKFATVNGYVTIRWYGTSNGYYSERVDFRKV